MKNTLMLVAMFFGMGAIVSFFSQVTIVPFVLLIIVFIVQNIGIALIACVLVQLASTATFAVIIKNRYSGRDGRAVNLGLLGTWTGYMVTATVFALLHYANVTG